MIHCFQRILFDYFNFFFHSRILYSGHVEYIDNRDNLNISTLPSWVTNVVIRAEAEDKYTDAYNTAYAADASAGTDDDTAAVTAGTNAGVAARNSYLSGNSITY